MKFFHISDLHLGKQLYGYDLREEQEDFIAQLLAAAREERPDAVVIAGDIYDRSVPSGSAMGLLEELFLGLDSLKGREKPIEVLLVAGNHDSGMRLQYGSAFLKRHHIHIAASLPQNQTEHLMQCVLSDAQGEVHFYLLPYVRAGMLRPLDSEGKLATTQDAVQFLLERENIDWSARNVLVSHQFYVHGKTAPVFSDSETAGLFVGELDSVDVSVVEKFDYIALGHIHSSQAVGKPQIRYCGTPYAYSVSEAGQEKSITVVELQEKGEVSIRFLPFVPKRSVRILKGSLQTLTAACEEACEDYVSIVLTQEDLPESPKEYLEPYYHRILEIRVDNERMRKALSEEESPIRALTPREAFEDFFAEVTGRPLKETEEEALQEILETVGKKGGEQ